MQMFNYGWVLHYLYHKYHKESIGFPLIALFVNRSNSKNKNIKHCTAKLHQFGLVLARDTSSHESVQAGLQLRQSSPSWSES